MDYGFSTWCVSQLQTHVMKLNCCIILKKLVYLCSSTVRAITPRSQGNIFTHENQWIYFGGFSWKWYLWGKITSQYFGCRRCSHLDQMYGLGQKHHPRLKRRRWRSPLRGDDRLNHNPQQPTTTIEKRIHLTHCKFFRTHDETRQNIHLPCRKRILLSQQESRGQGASFPSRAHTLPSTGTHGEPAHCLRKWAAGPDYRALPMGKCTTVYLWQCAGEDAHFATTLTQKTDIHQLI